MKAVLPRATLWLLSIGTAVLFLRLVLVRLVYPLELDCIEGVMMDHVARLALGQPIYVEPSLSFISLAYMPVFASASALLAHVFGPQFWEPRLLSLLSVMGLTVMIAAIVRAETRSWTLGAGGAALYLAGFGVTGGCYDVARPDSMMLCLALAGLVVLRFTRGVAGACGAALLLSIAFFTKQHAVWFVLAGLLHLAFNDRRRLPAFAVAAAVGCGGGYALLSWWLGPWFRFFTFEVPSGWSQVSLTRIEQYAGHGVLGTLALLSGPALLSLGLPSRPWRGPGGLWVWVGLGAVGTGLMATLDASAYRHVLMPTMVALAVLGPISLHRLLAALAPRPDVFGPNGFACLALALQFLPLAYPMHEQLPHERGRDARAQLLADLRAEPGPVLMPYHGFYCLSAGKPTSLHIIALDDIVRSRGNPLLARDPQFLDRMFAPLHAGSGRPPIVTDIPLAESGRLWAGLERSYRRVGSLGWISTALRPVTGNRFMPTWRYEPREPDDGVGAAMDSDAPLHPEPSAPPPDR
jgi:hypothetical protein